MTWTKERVSLLIDLWTSGKSASIVAKEIGSVSRNAVIGKIHRLGISNRIHIKKALPSTLDNAFINKRNHCLFNRKRNIPFIPTQNNRILIDSINQTFST